MPLLNRNNQNVRKHSVSRRHGIILPQDWNKLTASLPSWSGYQNSEADYRSPKSLSYQLPTNSRFYHHSNLSAASFLPTRLSQGSAPLAECNTFLDSDSEYSPSSSPHTAPPSSVNWAVTRPAALRSQRWPFRDVAHDSDFELDYPEIDTLGPLGTLLHELNDTFLPIREDHLLMRLEGNGIRNLQAEWMKRCQTLGERRVMRTVEQGCGRFTLHKMAEEWHTAEIVGYRPFSAR
jgi:hypothetical protein